MDIMNMTVGQLLHNICTDLPTALISISFLLNAEGIIRQYAVNKGYTKTVNWCDHIAKFLNFLTDVLPAVFQKHFTKAVPIVLLCLGLLFATGCASFNQKAICLHVTANNSALPIYGVAGIGDADICYISCLGNCPRPADNTAIIELEKAYATANSNKIKVTIPMTAELSPVTK